MDTKIPDRPFFDLHPTSKRPHAVFGVNSTVTAQASDDKVHYLQRLLLVSVIRAITMCASIALRSLLRLSPRGVRGVSHGYSIGPDNYDRLCLAMQVASIAHPLARRHFAHLFHVSSSFSPSRLLQGGKRWRERVKRGDPIYWHCPAIRSRSSFYSRVHLWRKLMQVTWFHARDDRARIRIIDVLSTELRLILS